MSSLSCSFTLGKASTGNANIEHNNREFVSSNVDVTKVADNVVYVRENVRDVYKELFDETLKEYNAKQTRKDRIIGDYFQHISDGNREESYYEIIVQFGDMDSAGIGTKNGELARKMLDKYVKHFQERNPNLRVFNAVLHADEKSYHAHINFVPFYTKNRNIGMQKGVSLKSALIEQGFEPKGRNQNQLVMWEQSEMQEMECILQAHGLNRDVKNANYAHQSVSDFKASQDWRKLPKRKRKSSSELTQEQVQKLAQERNLLQVENAKLFTEKQSEWRSFFFSDAEKLAFMLGELSKNNIPLRETETGFEIQACYLEKVRQIEKQYVSPQNSNRDILKDLVDKIVMQAADFDDIFSRLEKQGYEIKQGKYLAIKPPNEERFIRIKSLGEMYTELALRTRINNRNIYEKSIAEKLASFTEFSVEKLPEYKIYATVWKYILTFKQDVLPAQKVYHNQTFSWVNDEQLDRLATLNKKINSGMSLASLRTELEQSEKEVAEKEKAVSTLKSELKFFVELYRKGECYFKYHSNNAADKAVLDEHRITADNYERIMELIEANKNEIAELEQSLQGIQKNLLDTVDTLDTLEKVMNMTYVDTLVQNERNRRNSELINGVKSADISLAESQRIDTLAERLAEVADEEERRSYRKM